MNVKDKDQLIKDIIHHTSEIAKADMEHMARKRKMIELRKECYNLALNINRMKAQREEMLMRLQ